MLDDGIDLVSLTYQAPSWSHPRRVVGIRQQSDKRLNAKGKTRALEASDPKWGRYRFIALVTDLTLPAAEVWRLYRGRADCPHETGVIHENRIKELKYDLAVDSFCLPNFRATEASLHIALLAYNFMSLFRQAALRGSVLEHGSQDIQHTLKTLRFKLFAKAGYTTCEGRKDILKLSLAMHKREWMEGLWDRSKTFSLPVHFVPIFSSA